MDWISVEARLPDERVEVLAYDGSDIEVAAIYFGTWASDATWFAYHHDVTHWMPLPSPPVDSAVGP